MADNHTPLPEELCRRVRGLQVSVLRRIRSGFAGAYASTFRGPGIEFEEFTPYRPGDDVRHIDWHVTARRREPHVKRYREERQLRMVLVLDSSTSMLTGSTEPTTWRRALEVAALLALSAVYNGDRVGALMFDERVRATITPRQGEKHALNLLRRVLAEGGGGSQTDLRPVLARLRNLRSHAVVVLLSDFLSHPNPWEPSVRRLLATCADRHEMIAMRFVAPVAGAEADAPIICACEAESGRRLFLDARGQGRWAGQCERHRRLTLDALASCGVRTIEMEPHEDQVSKLRRFFGRIPPRLPL